MEGFLTYLFGVLVSPSIDTVVRNVQSSLGEPLNISLLERSGHDGGVRTVPVKVLLGHLKGTQRMDKSLAIARLVYQLHFCRMRMDAGLSTSSTQAVLVTAPTSLTTCFYHSFVDFLARLVQSESLRKANFPNPAQKKAPHPSDIISSHL